MLVQAAPSWFSRCARSGAGSCSLRRQAQDHCQHRRAGGHRAHPGASGESCWRRVPAGACITVGTRAAGAAATDLKSVLMKFACRELTQAGRAGLRLLSAGEGFQADCGRRAVICMAFGSWRGGLVHRKLTRAVHKARSAKRFARGGWVEVPIRFLSAPPLPIVASEKSKALSTDPNHRGSPRCGSHRFHTHLMHGVSDQEIAQGVEFALFPVSHSRSHIREQGKEALYPGLRQLELSRLVRAAFCHRFSCRGGFHPSWDGRRVFFCGVGRVCGLPDRRRESQQPVAL